MNRNFTVLLYIILSILFLQCVSSPMPGLLITNTGQHVYGTSPSGAKFHSGRILKSGESCSMGSFFLVTLFFYGGGGNVEEAMERGGIRKVSIVDRRSRAILFGLYHQECVVVWGE